MFILKEKLNKEKLFKLATVKHDIPMIKAVVDVGRRIIAIDAPMHADLETFLLKDGSKQEDLWGINFHEEGEEFVEFDSLINIRPRQNIHMYVDDENTRNLILEVVDEWILTI